MFSIKQLKPAVLLLVLACASTALAQQATPQPTPQSMDPNVKLGIKNRVFEIKYRDPESLVPVLKLLTSNYGAMSVSAEYKTLTVRDFPENIATIEEAIKRLDVPLPLAPDIEFHVHVLIATNGPNTSNPPPAEMNAVIKQLQNTLNYKSYYVMASAVLRTKAGSSQGIAGNGVADFRMNTEGAARNSPIIYNYQAKPVTLNTGEGGATIAQLGMFTFSMKIPIEVSPGQIQYDNVGFQTPVSIREGERVVVGTTTMQDKGVIVVLSASVRK